MISWKDLSLPPKIIALIIASVLVALTIFFTLRFVYGQVTVTSPIAGAFVFTDGDDRPQILPLVIRKKPGKYVYIVGAPGKLNTPVTVKIYAFLKRSMTVTPLPDYSVEKEHFRIVYDYQNASYTIVPHINFGPEFSPSQHISNQWQNYEAYAKEALSYIRSQGGDPKKLRIAWWAQEWWPAGKTISY